MLRLAVILALLVPVLCSPITLKLNSGESKIFSGHEKYIVHAETLDRAVYSLFILRNETISYNDNIDGCLFTTNSCHVNGTDRRSKFVAIKNEDEYDAEFYLSIEKLTYPDRMSSFGLVAFIIIFSIIAIPLLLIFGVIIFLIEISILGGSASLIEYCYMRCKDYRRTSEV